MKPTWEEVSRTGGPERWYPSFDGILRLLRDLELDWSTSLLCFLRFLCHVFLVGLAGLTNVRTLRTSARAIKLTRN